MLSQSVRRSVASAIRARRSTEPGCAFSSVLEWTPLAAHHVMLHCYSKRPDVSPRPHSIHAPAPTRPSTAHPPPTHPPTHPTAYTRTYHYEIPEHVPAHVPVSGSPPSGRPTAPAMANDVVNHTCPVKVSTSSTACPHVTTLYNAQSPLPLPPLPQCRYTSISTPSAPSHNYYRWHLTLLPVLR